MNAEEVLTLVVETLNKAVVDKVAVYDMENYTPFYEYTVIGSVNSGRQGNAAISYLKKAADEANISVRSSIIHDDTRWFLLDLGSVVVHIFVGDERQRYNLDSIYNFIILNKE